MRRVTGRLAPLLLTIPCLGCAHASQVTRKLETAATMKSVVLENVPSGTPIADARQFMERERFKCELVQDGIFLEEQSSADGSSDRPIKHEGIDFILCRREEKMGFWVSRVWSVALVTDHDVVNDVMVRMYYIGP